MAELAAALDGQAGRLAGALQEDISARAHALELIASRPCLADPQHALVDQRLADLDLASDRLMRAIPDMVRVRADACDHAAARLRLVGRALLELPRTQAQIRAGRLRAIGDGLVRPFERELAGQAGRAHALSPLAVIARGYSMVVDGDGHVVASVDAVADHDQVDVRLSDGVMKCEVIHKEHAPLYAEQAPETR